MIGADTGIRDPIWIEYVWLKNPKDSQNSGKPKEPKEPKEDTDGIELTWGNATSVLEILHKIGRREQGIGDLLADGSTIAAQRIGSEAEEFLTAIDGEEPPMHDPKKEIGFAASYALDPTPARHTNWSPGKSSKFPTMPEPPADKNQFNGRGRRKSKWSSTSNKSLTFSFLLFPKINVSTEVLPFMGYKEADLFGVPAKIFRISFSGELAYEINVESNYGIFMWEKIIEIGKEMNIEPYGTEALSTLRIEMGHVAGSEIDSRTIPYDLSLDGMLSKKKDFVGKRSLSREAFIDPKREKIVGVIPVDKKTMIPEGSHLVQDDKANLPNPKLGHISASCWSVEYNNPFSLAILRDGKNKIGERLYALSPLKNKNIPVEIVSSHYVDPKGERVRS
mgnify:CR=1 FL=1